MNDNILGSTVLFAIGTLLLVSQQGPSQSTATEPAVPVAVVPQETKEKPTEPTPQAVEPEGLKLLNSQRRQRGLGPLVLDPALQAGAEAKASIAASRRRRGHLGGSLYGASKEGVGYGSSRTFRACYAYTAPAGTPVGASIRQGSDGHWYCCLLVRYSGKLASSPSSVRYRRRLFR